MIFISKFIVDLKNTAKIGYSYKVAPTDAPKTLTTSSTVIDKLETDKKPPTKPPLTFDNYSLLANKTELTTSCFSIPCEDFGPIINIDVSYTFDSIEKYLTCSNNVLHISAIETLVVQYQSLSTGCPRRVSCKNPLIIKMETPINYIPVNKLIICPCTIDKRFYAKDFNVVFFVKTNFQLFFKY